MSISQIISQTNTIAIIGCSSNIQRTSRQIAGYLLHAGFEIIPINPNEESVLGRKSYPSIHHLPDNAKFEMVVIFRNSRYTEEMVGQIVEWGAGLKQKPVIWTQLNVSTPEAKKLAENNGFQYVENRCIMVDHRDL